MKQLFILSSTLLGLFIPTVASANYNVSCNYSSEGNGTSSDFTPLADPPKMEGNFEIYAEDTFDSVFYRLGMGHGYFVLTAFQPNTDTIYAQSSADAESGSLSLKFGVREVNCSMKFAD